MPENSAATLTCPRCTSALVDVVSMTGWERVGELRHDDPFIVGRCDSCSRQYEYRAATGEYVSQTYEPLCRKCGHPVTLDLPASTSTRLVFTCIEHKWQRWTHDAADDVWTDFSLMAR